MGVTHESSKLSVEELKLKIAEEKRQGFAYSELNEMMLRLISANPELRDSYLWGAIQACFLAKNLGHGRVSFLEFGVAGGRGILALEKTAELLEKEFDISIEIYGFDTGKGLPKPEDYRDLPNLWSQGQFPMDKDKLLSRLTRAELVLGEIKDTIFEFIERDIAPVGFVSIDLDMYTSTRDALQLLQANFNKLLPRIQYYFDDLLAFTMCEFNGEKLAINEFNQQNDKKKIAQISGLKYFVPKEHKEDIWLELMYMAHLFEHPQYNNIDGLLRRQRLDIE